MTVQATTAKDFEKRHEAEAFKTLSRKLEETQDSADDIYLIGNVDVESVEIDAILLTKNSISVIDFKGYPEGKVEIWDDKAGRETGIQSGTWYMRTRNNEKIKIKGGTHTNPFGQIRTNRSGLRRRLLTKNEQHPLFEKDWDGKGKIHISGVVCFHEPVQFPAQKLEEAGVAKWFHVTDLDNFHIPNGSMNLSAEKLDAIAQYIQFSDSQKWEEEAKKTEAPVHVPPVRVPREEEAKREGAPARVPRMDSEDTGKFLGLSFLFSYLVLSVLLWARPLAGFFSRFYSGEVTEVTLYYTGDSWLFGIADTWFAGGSFNEWSLAWFISWFITIITLPVFASIVVGTGALLLGVGLVMLIVLGIWNILVYFWENPS